MIKEFLAITLIELLIVMCILSILGAIVYPSYTVYLIKSHRSDGKAALIELATQMEHYYITNNHYPNELNQVLRSSISAGGWYELSISASASSYTLSASPIKSQIMDKECGVLTLDNLGVKGRGGTTSREVCW